jgi:hypothetical protein
MNRSIALIPFAALALAGCARPPEGGGAAARRCDVAGPGVDVYVELAYAPDGMPIATPDTCTVTRGAGVEWRGPDGNPEPFEIRFKRANPIPAAPQGQLRSKAAHARQVAWGRVDAATGRYDYGIRAGSKERDPAIIIR